MQKQYETGKPAGASSIDEVFGPQVLDMKNYMKQGTDNKEHQTLANGINTLVGAYAMTHKLLEQYGITDPMTKGLIYTELGKGYLGLVEQLTKRSAKDGKYNLAATMYGMLAGMYLRTAEAEMKKTKGGYAARA